MGLKNLKKDTRGFTLIEIIVVLAILAVLIAIAVPTMNGILDSAKEKTVYANARAAYVAYDLLTTDRTEVSAADLATVLDKTKTGDTFAVIVEKAEKNSSDIIRFWYRDHTLSEDKYVLLPIGTPNNNETKSASIVTKADLASKSTRESAKPYVAAYEKK